LFSELKNLELRFKGKFPDSFFSDFFCINWDSKIYENLKINNEFGDVRLKIFLEVLARWEVPNDSISEEMQDCVNDNYESLPKISLKSNGKMTQKKIGASSWLPVSDPDTCYIVSDAMNIELSVHISRLANENMSHFSNIYTVEDISGNKYYCDHFGEIINQSHETDLSYFYLKKRKMSKVPFLSWETGDLTRVLSSGATLAQTLKWCVLSKTAEMIVKKISSSF
jgi:hypothetical protein